MREIGLREVARFKASMEEVYIKSVDVNKAFDSIALLRSAVGMTHGLRSDL